MRYGGDPTAAMLEEGFDGPQDPVVAHLEDISDRAFGEAIDAAAKLRVDFDKHGPYSAYIEDCKRELIEKLQQLDEIDPTDIGAIISVQLAVRNFKSVIGFAHKLIDRYSPPLSDSDAQSEPGVGEPLYGEASARGISRRPAG